MCGQVSTVLHERRGGCWRRPWCAIEPLLVFFSFLFFDAAAAKPEMHHPPRPVQTRIRRLRPPSARGGCNHQGRRHVHTACTTPPHQPPPLPPLAMGQRPCRRDHRPCRRRADAGHPYPQRQTPARHRWRGGRRGVALAGGGGGGSGATVTAAQRRRRRCGRRPQVRTPPTLLQWTREGGEVAPPRNSTVGRRDAGAPLSSCRRAAFPVTAAPPRRVAAATAPWDVQWARHRADVPASRPRLPPAPGRHLNRRVCVLYRTHSEWRRGSYTDARAGHADPDSGGCALGPRPPE